MAMGAAPTEDPFGGRAFVSPAKIRILLTPTGPDVSPVDFEKWAANVRAFESIRLADLSPSGNGRAGPLPGSVLHRFGEVHISFVTSYDPSHTFLAPFAIHRQILGVLGLGSFTSSHDRSEFERAPSALRELHPSAIVHRAFIFDSQAGQEASIISRTSCRGRATPSKSDSDGCDSAETMSSFDVAVEDDQPPPSFAGFSEVGKSGLFMFPAIRKDGKDVKFYLNTLLRDFIRTLLDGLWELVQGLEGRPLETPRDTLEGGIVPSKQSTPLPSAQSSDPSSSTTPVSPTGSARSRASSFFSSFSSAASSASTHAPVGGGTQPIGVTVGQNSLSNAKSTVSKSSASKSMKSKRTFSMVGAGPTGAGRYAKIKADYSLLSGDLWGAIEGYDTCMSWLGKERALAGGQDAVWYASALEGWAVTRCLIFRMSGLEEKGPSLALPGSAAKDKEKKDKAVLENHFAKQEWVDIAEAYSLALQIYSKTLAPPRYLLESARSVASETPRDYTHPLIHSSACIAYARLLLAIWASSGWNAECFDQLIYGGVPPVLVEDVRPSPAMYASLSKASGVERHEIAAPTSLALTHSVSALKPPDQISILCSLANIYGCIGFLRREAYLLRQLQAAVVSLLAKALILHPREPQNTVHLLNQIKNSEHADLGTMVSQIMTSGLGQGADAVLILALQICETYGIDIDVEPLKKIPSHHILSRAAVTGRTTARGEPLLKRTSRASWDAQLSFDLRVYGEEANSLMQKEAPFGWADLQVALLKDTICVAEMLQDHVGMAFFAAILLRDFHELLSADEQQSLVKGLSRCVSTARWHDARDLEVLYWGPTEPLLSIEAEETESSQEVTEQPASELAPPLAGGVEGQGSVPGSSDPFFWNPIRFTATKTKQATLVQGEQATFLVTLQNPFKTPLDVSDMRLSTTGTAFDAYPVSIVLPPVAFYTLRLTGVPREPGLLAVKGVFLTLAGCQEREFRVLVHDEAAGKIIQGQEANADDRRTRLKVQGLDARPAFIALKKAGLFGTIDEKFIPKRSLANPRTVERYLQCSVVHSQPVLTIDSPSLVHRHLAIYEGEETIIKLRLTNSSNLPIDFVRIQICDDLAEAIRLALAEGYLLAEDAYQLEWGLLNEPVFSYRRKLSDIQILPGKTLILPIKIRGKADCTRASVIVDYAHVNATGRVGLVTEESRSFHTRKALFAFGITVIPPIEIGRLGVRAIQSTETQEETSSECMLTLDVRNTQRYSLNVTFELDGDDPENADHGRLVITRAISALSTARFSLPLAKFKLPSSVIEASIPSLSSRQFILSRIKLTPAEESQARRRFWHKQELLRRLRARWQDTHSGRSGRLAGLEETLVLDDAQLRALRIQPVTVSLSLRNGTGDMQTSIVPARSFQNIVGRVHNRSDRPVKLLYRLIPMPSSALDPTTADTAAGFTLDHATQSATTALLAPLAAAGHHSNDAVLSRLLITDGGLTCPVQPWPLPAGTVSEVITTGVSFLAEGTFGFLACVEEADELGGVVETTNDEEREQVGPLLPVERISEVSSTALTVDVSDSNPERY